MNNYMKLETSRDLNLTFWYDLFSKTSLIMHGLRHKMDLSLSSTIPKESTKKLKFILLPFCVSYFTIKFL